MTEDIIIPQIGESASELTLVRWVKEKGDPVREGDILFELDTEKSVIEIESVYSGVLTEILAEKGEKVQPLQVVGRISTGG